ncbi:hypothetical protein [Bifidobacterium crudilactis]|jgi:hypothetical protein|uniref:hypothetical protein n=1 Tax=Bifidobacterium crudilactis TaxID=327277 RepID=UPI002353C7C3|nr:hypothetical protein [Bifidobacterium crudilactis]MCI1218672.1 hypothetical protein [Bifidobacterium crudilactis]
MNTPGYAETTARRRIVFPWMGKRDRTGLPGTVVSSAIIRHQLRRYWPISLVGSAILLILGPVVALLSSDTQRARSYIVESMLNDQNFGFLAYQVLAPVVVAVAVFSYLDSKGRVAFIHAMPLTRNSLFRSNVLSGAILLFIPQFVLSLAMVPFVSMGFSGFASQDREGGLMDSYANTAVSVGTAGASSSSEPVQRNPDMGDLLRWFIVTSVIMLFIYALSVLASILSGNIGVAVLVSALLNGIVPALSVLTFRVLDMFLYGFSYDSVGYAAWMHPLIDLWMHGARVSPWTVAAFILVSVVVIWASGVLYRRLKSECAGSNITFGGFTMVATVLTTFVGACLAGMLLESLTSTYAPVRSNHGLFFLGAVLGAPVVFTVTSMTLCGTIRVFTLSSLKRFAAFVVIAAVFFSLTSFDLTGYEGRVPAQQDIASVTIPDIGLMALPYAGTNANSITLTDAQAIADARALHEEIISRSRDPKYDSLFTGGNAETGTGVSSQFASSSGCSNCYLNDDDVLSVEFHYRMHAGSSMNRSYHLYQKYLNQSDAYRRLVNDAGYRKANSLQTLGYDNIRSSEVSDVYGNSTYVADPEELNGPSTSLGAADARTLAKLLDEDYQSLPNAEVSSNLLSYDSNTGNALNQRVLIGISFQMDEKGSQDNTRVFYGITDDYTRTIAWLKDKGLYRAMISATEKLMPTSSS